MNTNKIPTAVAQVTRSSDEQFKITYWAGKWERYLFQTAPPATYERYSRALSKFLGYFPDKRFTYSFRRADVESYKQQRFKEGASPTTVSIELSVVRGFFRFLLRMNADGAFLNPALGVKVSVQRSGSKRHKVLVDEPEITL